MIQARSAGFTLMEVMVSIFILGVATVAVTGLAVTGVRTAFESERQTVALGLVNGEAETIKGMSYFQIGYADSEGTEPDGFLLRQELVTRNDLTFTLFRTVTLIDDPGNGTLPDGALTEASADYKQVAIKAAWLTSGGAKRDVAVVVTVTPQLNCAVGSAGSGGGQQCAPGQPNSCPDPKLLRSNTNDNSCVSGGGAFVSAGAANGGTIGSCKYNSITCPASGRCPAPSAAPTCPAGAAFCPSCVSNIDCPFNSICSNGQCLGGQAGACTSNDQCGAGKICNDGFCAPDCNLTACTGGKVCNSETGACSTNCLSGLCTCDTGYKCGVLSGLCILGTPFPLPTPWPQCGDGIVDPGESCDNGVALNGRCPFSCNEFCALNDCPPPPSETPTPTASTTPTPSATPTPTVTPTPIPTPCFTSLNCTAGQTCVTGFCVPPESSTTPTPSTFPSTSPTSSGFPSGSPSPSNPGGPPVSPTPGGGCSSNAQCPAGMTCSNGICTGTTGGGCTSSSQCSSGQSCTNGVCQGSWCGDTSLMCVAYYDPSCVTQCVPPSPSPSNSTPPYCPGCGVNNPGGVGTAPNVWCDSNNDGNEDCGPSTYLPAQPGETPQASPGMSCEETCLANCNAAGGNIDCTNECESVRTACCYSLDTGNVATGTLALCGQGYPSCPFGQDCVGASMNLIGFPGQFYTPGHCQSPPTTCQSYGADCVNSAGTPGQCGSHCNSATACKVYSCDTSGNPSIGECN